MDKEVNNVSNGLISNGRRPASVRPKVVDVNACLTCRLCTGYLVDAVTITDCLHTCKNKCFWFLRISLNCPVCDHAISTLPAEANLLRDHLLQDIVYRLVPGLYRGEKRRQAQFHLREDRPEQVNGSVWSSFPKTAFIREQFPRISLVLERTACTWSKSSAQPYVESRDDHIYLLCSPNVTVSVLKKLIHHKMNVVRNLDYTVWIYYADEFLKDYYSLQDIAEMCNWQMMSPLNLFYMILGANEQASSISDILLHCASATRLQNSDNRRLVVKISLKRTRSKKKSRNSKRRGSLTYLLREVVATNQVSSLSVGGKYENIPDSPQTLFSSKSQMLTHQKASTFSGTEWERNKISSTTGDVGAAAQDSLSQKTTAAVGSFHNLDSSDIDAKCVDCNSSANVHSHKSHSRDLNANCLLPFKKRRRTLSTGADKTSVCSDAEFVSTVTPEKSKTSGSRVGGCSFNIYEDLGENVGPPPKVGVIICRGQAMTLQDHQKLLSASSSSQSNISNLPKTFGTSPYKDKTRAERRRVVCPERVSESENLGEGRLTTYSQRNKKSKELKIKHAVEYLHCSDLDHYQTSITLKTRSALRVRGNVRVNQTESTAS